MAIIDELKSLVPGIPWEQRQTDEFKARAKAYNAAHSKIGYAWNGVSQDVAGNFAKSMKGELP